MSKIQWTDVTWNPVRGCVKVSAGCKNCYAETFAERWRGIAGHPYEQGFDLRLVPEKLEEPLKWKRPRRVFVNSMSDLFQDGVPFEFIDKVFAVMALTPQHTYQVLTKRPERMLEYFERGSRFDLGAWAPVEVECMEILHNRREVDIRWVSWDLPGWPLPNVWLGVSCENRATYVQRIPLLALIPAAVRFVSMEPLLSDLGDLMLDGFFCETYQWAIVGGESGPGARPFNIQWARDVIAQCRAAGVACFVKQLGAFPVDTDYGYGKVGVYAEYDKRSITAAKALGLDYVGVNLVLLKDRKGGNMEEWPADLRVREFPETAAVHV